MRGAESTVLTVHAPSQCSGADSRVLTIHAVTSTVRVDVREKSL